jgi:hypothetical protein
MTEPHLHQVGRFNVRIVPAPFPLYHGVQRDFSRERHDYEQGTILEVFDRRYPHTEAGQFIGSYNLATIVGLKDGIRLDLHGGIPDWTMTEAETTAFVALARSL